MKKEVIAQKDPKSPISEIFRTLRTNLQFMNSQKELTTLLITSTLQSEGKSWISANLAVTFAQTGKRVVLIDADMRKGRQYSIFGVSPQPGLSNFLSGVYEGNADLDISEYIRPTEVENLYVIPAGTIPPNPAELLNTRKMPEMLQMLRDCADVIILDGPPALLVTDAALLSRYVDSTLIVTKHKSTKMDNVLKIKKDIENVGGKVAGVILNQIPISAKKYESTYYYGSSATTKATNHSPKIEGKMPARTKVSPKIKKEDTQEVPTIRLENKDGVSLEKTDEILKQINDYLNVEKSRLNDKDDKK